MPSAVNHPQQASHRSAGILPAGAAASCRRDLGRQDAARPATWKVALRLLGLAMMFWVIAATAHAADLPIVVRPATSSVNSDTFVVMLSGDGGWRRLDILVTNELRKQGIPVVGLLSNSYFAPGRTAEEAAADLERLIREYAIRWNKPRVLLIGYSRGADVLPFLVNRLPPDIRAKIAAVALLGLEGLIDFKYHPSWIPFYHPHDPERPVKPEVEKLRGLKILCVYGAQEQSSICPALDPHYVQTLRTPGHHHFAGHYVEVARAILGVAK